MSSSKGQIVGVTGDMDAIASAAENTGIDYGLEQTARMVAHSLMDSAAKMALHAPWMPGAADKFMATGELEQIVDTNQGRFVVAVRRG
jgi:hypothetical protein